jgi:aryl-alcohol dehydrogenase-like predicted oxidoreductase
MNTRSLGLSGINITAMGLGTNYVGGHNLYANVDENEGVRLVQRAIDMGVTHLDTADGYGFGRSEELVGKAIAGRRDEVVLATKGSVLFGEHGKGFNNDPVYLRGALERSLKRLNVEYVDLYYIHRHDGKTPPAEALGALMDFKNEGLIRAVGVSNFDLPTLVEASKAGQIDALQSRYNLLQREVEDKILPWCVDNNVSFIPWGGLAYGLLGGRYSRDFKLDDNDWRHRSGAFDDGVFERNMDAVDGLKSIAAEANATPAHLALQWLLSRDAVSSVIAGAKNADQVSDNIAAESASVTAEQLAAVDALTRG